MVLKRMAPLFVLLAACSERPTQTDPGTTDVSAKYSDRSGAIRTYEDVEKYAGEVVTLSGRFDHIRGEHGVLILESDLRIYIPHFDLFKRNDDWLKYVGRRVTATGRLHTYTRDIPGYHGPSLEITAFSGTAE